MKEFYRKALSYMVVAPLVITNMLTTPDKQKITYTHYNAGHQQVVIIAPGFFNSKDSLLIKKLKDDLIDRYDVLIFDFRGHGKSSGLFTWTSKENLDLETVLDYAKNKYQKIGIISFSFGAAVSIRVLTERNDIASLIAISAPYDCSKIEYHFWNLDLENDIFYNLGAGKTGKGIRSGPFWLAKKKPIDLVDKLKCPVLYIHGDKDWVTGYAHSQKLYEKTKVKKKLAIIKNGSHAEYLLRKNEQETINLIRDWLEETL